MMLCITLLAEVIRNTEIKSQPQLLRNHTVLPYIRYLIRALNSLSASNVSGPEAQQLNQCIKSKRTNRPLTSQ